MSPTILLTPTPHTNSMTAGAVLDRSQGNTGGLGGRYGVFYALGRPSIPALTRPLRCV